MKRSELEAALGGTLSRGWVLTILAKLDTTDLVYEPEEEPFPERLKMVGRLAVFDREMPLHEQIATNNQVATAIVYQGAHSHPASRFNEKVLAEAVRRYNAWPELGRSPCETTTFR